MLQMLKQSCLYVKKTKRRGAARILKSTSKFHGKFLILMTSQLMTEKPTLQRKKKLEFHSNH